MDTKTGIKSLDMDSWPFITCPAFTDSVLGMSTVHYFVQPSNLCIHFIWYPPPLLTSLLWLLLRVIYLNIYIIWFYDSKTDEKCWKCSSQQFLFTPIICLIPLFNWPSIYLRISISFYPQCLYVCALIIYVIECHIDSICLACVKHFLFSFYFLFCISSGMKTIFIPLQNYSFYSISSTLDIYIWYIFAVCVWT